MYIRETARHDAVSILLKNIIEILVCRNIKEYNYNWKYKELRRFWLRLMLFLFKRIIVSYDILRSPDAINSINLITRNFAWTVGCTLLYITLLYVRMGVREQRKISRCNLCTSRAHERDISVLMQPLFGNKTFVKPDVQR